MNLDLYARSFRAREYVGSLYSDKELKSKIAEIYIEGNIGAKNYSVELSVFKDRNCKFGDSSDLSDYVKKNEFYSDIYFLND